MIDVPRVSCIRPLGEASVNSLSNRVGLGVARHAALALLGWYLMVPPLNTYLNNPKSFRGWNAQGSYDTARECESAAAQGKPALCLSCFDIEVMVVAKPGDVK